MNLKKKSQEELQVLFAMGGSDDAPDFSTIFATNISRKTFVDSCFAFMTTHGFDGINIDWHFPREDGTINDKVNFYFTCNITNTSRTPRN